MADAEHGRLVQALHTDMLTCMASAVAEIHSSERRKPSEVSMRLRLVLSLHGSPSRFGADALSLLEMYEVCCLRGTQSAVRDPARSTTNREVAST